MRRLVLASLIVVLAACGHDKGNPAQISRDFMVAVWTGDVERAQELTCKEWRDVTAEWARGGNASLEVDTSHMVFEVQAKTDKQADLLLSGTVTFTSAEGQVEVRTLDDTNTTLFTLVDESGWKVCDVR